MNMTVALTGRGRAVLGPSDPRRFHQSALDCWPF